MAGQSGHQPRPPRRRVDGVVLVDKPVGFTSNAVLQRVKRSFRALKAGHTGTLDPLASGLLPICLGEATKFSMGLLDADKRYRAVLHLGVTTETGDVEGAVLQTRDVAVDRPLLDQVLPGFRGNILQVPHRYSAIKRDGRALYSYARAGEVVAVEPRAVRIHSLEIESWVPPLLALDVLCSKGTYVRSLGEDIGEALGCGAHVSELRRLAVGRFDIGAAIGVDALEALDEAERDSILLPVECMVDAFPVIALQDAGAVKFLHGQSIPVEAGPELHGLLVAVHRAGGSDPGVPGFLGMARVELVAGHPVLVPARLMATPQSGPE